MVLNVGHSHIVSQQKRISVVIPIYNEVQLLDELTSRVKGMLQQQPQYDWQIIYVNDGSQDGSHLKMRQLAEQHPWLTCMHLSRNFGHQIAISAGIDHASGDAVIVMDGDLQDPPEVIPEMLELWKAGYDVVYGTRKQRKGENYLKLVTAMVFYRFLQRLSSISIPLDTGDFRLMARPVVNALCHMREKNRFIRGMVSWTGYRQTSILYERDCRYAGKTKFSLLKMVRFATDGLLSFSKVPLQIITSLGFIISLCSFLAIPVIIYMRLTMSMGMMALGWSSLMVILLLQGGILLICFGMLGEYMGRIFDEVIDRPLYLVSRIEAGCHTDARLPDVERRPVSTSHLTSKEMKLYEYTAG